MYNQRKFNMEFLSIFTESSVLMTVIALLFALFGVRCLIYGIMGGTSTLIRIIGTVIFAGLAYYFWCHAGTLHGSNVIDQVFFDCWDDVKSLFRGVISMIRS